MKTVKDSFKILGQIQSLFEREIQTYNNASQSVRTLDIYN